jgi:hypothetical protein
MQTKLTIGNIQTNLHTKFTIESLLFDYEQVEWLRARVQDIPIRLVFESALELMGTTQLGGFKVGSLRLLFGISLNAHVHVLPDAWLSSRDRSGEKAPVSNLHFVGFPMQGLNEDLFDV